MSRLLSVDSTDFTVTCHDDGVAEVVLGQPGAMPTLSADGHGELARLWQRLAHEPGVRSILVRSQGRGFCAGGDMALVEDMLGNHAARLRVMDEGRELVRGMLDCDRPIISAINGAAVGAGAAVALLADISIAAEDAKILDGHTKLGVAAGDHAAGIWPLLCGLAKARYYLLTCRPVTGAEAERIGLVSLATPAATLDEEAWALARELARGSASALAFTKRSLNHWVRTMWPAFEHSLALEILGFAGPDIHEGLQALAEKRAPDFKA